MTQEKRNRASWMLTIGMIAAGFGLLWLLFKVTPVPVPLLIALPFISYFGGIFFSNLPERTSFTLFIAAVAVFAGIAVSNTKEKQYSFYAEPYIDGKYVDKEVLIEPIEGGSPYWE